MTEPTRPTDAELEGKAAVRAYYEGLRSKIKEPVWTARQRPKEPTT